MRRPSVLTSGGAVLALIGGQLDWPNPSWARGASALALAVLVAALLAARLRSRAWNAIIAAVAGLALLAAAVMGGVDLGPVLSGLGAIACLVAAGFEFATANPVVKVTHGDDAWARFTAGDDPTDENR